jgi:hypothetical protein
MAKEVVYKEVTKWVVIAVAVAFVGVITATVQGDTYSKDDVDQTIERVEAQHNRDVDRLYDGIDQIQQNVDWLVRDRGGEPIRSETEEDR